MRKPLDAMFGAYVFEGNQIIKVRLQPRSSVFLLFVFSVIHRKPSRRNVFVRFIVLTYAAQNKRDATCLAEATFTGGHR
jgi:hypothetical protein